MTKNPFGFASENPVPAESPPQATPIRYGKGAGSGRGFPWVPAVLLLLILLGCAFAGVLSGRDPAYMDLENRSVPPNAVFCFGTDPMGRDIFSMIWHGGRVSLSVGLAATAISTGIAILYGCVSGTAPDAVDAAMMRFIEAASGIPSILTVIFLQAILGRTGPVAIAAVLGATGWMSMARVVRSEVRQMRDSEFILAAKQLGGGYFYRLRRHLLPGFFPSILFMVVTSIGSAIGMESTLSFLGIGLPVETVSWGSMLSQADRALLSGGWWLILIPGMFLAVTLACITDLGNYLRKSNLKACSNLSSV